MFMDRDGEPIEILSTNNFFFDDQSLIQYVDVSNHGQGTFLSDKQHLSSITLSNQFAHYGYILFARRTKGGCCHLSILLFSVTENEPEKERKSARR